MRKIRMMAIGAILSVCGIGTTALARGKRAVHDCYSQRGWIAAKDFGIETEYRRPC